MAIMYIAKPAVQVEVKVPRDLTAAELAAACAPQVEETVGELEDAQNKVQFLEKEVDARQARVTELEEEMKRRSQRGSALVRELEQAKADLAEARQELEIARAEKERLVVELTETRQELAETQVKLEEQVVKTERAKEDALVNKWYRFINDSQLEICEKGNRKKLGQCRETVQATLMTNARRDRFSHCVRSGQATPTVRELEKNETLPRFAEMIDDEQKQTRDWYVLFCDPTLPEKEEGFLGEDHLPTTAGP
jgi:septal ring factor EnvC (AmiA/AmiB activator)